MQAPPISQAEIETRISDHLDELLTLWWAEQGTEKVRDLDLMASVVPLPREGALRALDFCCGPGDVGRAIHRVHPAAQIDCIDRDPFLTAVCAGVNRRDGVSGKIVTRDLEDADWSANLQRGYHVVAVANALHWFDLARARDLLRDIHGLLLKGGVFLFAEPVSTVAPFSDGFEKWKERQPSRYSRENWMRFWTRANAILGYNHIKLLGSRDDEHIGDSLSVRGWIDLVGEAGFAQLDIILRDADEVIIAAVKP
jgi:SAM-dependent methyltransferase